MAVPWDLANRAYVKVPAAEVLQATGVDPGELEPRVQAANHGLAGPVLDIGPARRVEPRDLVVAARAPTDLLKLFAAQSLAIQRQGEQGLHAFTPNESGFAPEHILLTSTDISRSWHVRTMSVDDSFSPKSSTFRVFATKRCELPALCPD